MRRLLLILYLISFVAVNADTKYVSPAGSNANNGITPSEPVLTVDKALSSGADTVICLSGTYRQHIDLRKARHSRVVLRGDGNVVFSNPASTIADDGSEQIVNGKVYKLQLEKGFEFHERNNRLYQEGVADKNTQILPDEHHHLHGDITHRCDATIIFRSVADNLDNAIKEINNSDSCKWFYDEDKSILYFSRPEKTSPSHRLCYSTGGNLLSGNSEHVSVEIYDIKVRYMALNLNDMLYPMAVRCTAEYVFGGGSFYWHNSTDATMVECEASSATYGNTGDGFNGHSTPGKSTSATLIECWSHDNNDDGFSDHERCRSRIMGGLFEYNGKAGVTPAYGSHNKTINALSRRNYSGFFYVGTVEDPADGPGSMECVDCMSINNTRPATKVYKFHANEAKGYGYGVEGDGNTARIKGCKSIGDKVSYHEGELSHLLIEGK